MGPRQYVTDFLRRAFAMGIGSSGLSAMSWWLGRAARRVKTFM
jgi:hypothetical protein